MKTYIYTLEYSSDKRGFNRTVTVWRVKNNTPIWLGKNDAIHSKAWYGAKTEALLLIAKIEGYKVENYRLVNKDVKIIHLLG